MRTPRHTSPDTGSPQPAPAARGRRAHAGPPADEQPAGPERAAPAPTTGPGAGGQGATETPGATEAQSGTGAQPGAQARPRAHLRPRTVRAKIVSLLMVPVVSLLGLWGFATVTTAQDIARLRQLQRIDAEIRAPLTAAVTAVQAERRAAVRQIASPGPGRVAELKEQGRATDAAVARLDLGGGHTVADTGGLPGDASRRVETFIENVRALRTVRTAVLGGKTDWDTAYTRYTDTIAAAFAASGALTGVQDGTTGSDARVLLEFVRATEMLAREDALLSSAHLGTELGAARQRAFAGAVENRRHLAETAGADLRGPDRDAWRALTAQPEYQQLTAAEDRIRTAPPGRKAATAVPASTWDSAHGPVRAALDTLEADARRSAADRADPFADGALTPAGAAVLFGLAAVAASLVISVRIGRGLVVELVSLRNTALEIARRKLPHAMRRLRAGEEIDVRAEAPPGPAAQDEIGQVGEALGTVHRAALTAAVERAELAGGISGVFVNLARRSQVLVHRQLNLLDSMERRADDPSELGDLFRLDHLTTRMRRHAESLIILSGAAPGRAWRMPVPLTNVVRAAVSEIEDYARVEVRHLPETSVVGAAVADLTHLLAELVENAAQFSPPHTKVRISGEPVGNGYALEIEDRGLGMGKETLADANRRIEQSEALDLFDSDRLGLFVVSRLSARHDIRVHLRTSPYGGTTAVVLLPTALLQGALTAGAPAAAASRTDRATPTLGPLPSAAPAAAESAGHPPPPPVAAVPSAARRALRPAEPQPSHGPRSQPAPPPAAVTTLRSRGQDDAGAEQGTTDGLPRRVRQSHLVAQLREAPPPAPTHEPAEPDTDRRTPEQVRDRMTAYRDGWTRGGGPAPGTPNGRTPPNRTRSTGFGSEGDDR
ncbi:nitrate- and nitrite sensing domain-containing protein [Streptomyces purpureus]|uniref:sensor histidine kinase n=1 Tax=Streptomyces purpureus TaxID=1951 RepID=UPI003790C7D7